MGFYLVPLSVVYFSVISFCLTNCVYGLLSTGCRVVVPLVSVDCPLVGDVGPGACACFLVGGSGVHALLGGVESFPSDDQGCIRWYVLGVSVNLV